MAAQLQFEVRNQNIVRTDSFLPMSQSKNYLLAHFEFKTGEWGNTPYKTAIFTSEDGTSYKQIIDTDGDCLVPWENIKDSGYVYISVFGGDRVTAGKLKIFIGDSGYVDDAENETEPTTEVYDQMIGKINDIKSGLDYINDGNIDGGLFTDWDKEV